MTLKTSKIILICFLATVVLSLFSTNTKTDSQHKSEVQQVVEKERKKPEEQKEKETKIEKEGKGKKGLEMYRVNYNNRINDYKITVDWYPHTGASKNSVLGKGEIHFSHSSGAQFKITHKNFYLIDIIPFNWETGKLCLPSEKEITLDYIQYADTSEFIQTDLPFLFYDINFDGKDELVLIHPGAAQRNRDYLAVYFINDKHIVENLPNSDTNHGSDYAFDSYTKFNKMKKTVTMFDSGGATIYEERIYKNNKNTNRLEMEEVNGSEGVFTYNLKKPFSIPQDSIDLLFTTETDYWENWY